MTILFTETYLMLYQTIGHQFMATKHGILHRDISAGNVYLHDQNTNNPNGVGKGFIADLELAAFTDPKVMKETHYVPEDPSNLGHIRFKAIDAEAKQEPGPTITVCHATVLEVDGRFGSSAMSGDCAVYGPGTA